MRIATLHRWTRRLVWFVLLTACLWGGFVTLRAHPEDLPWTPLDLDRPVGLFTGRKVAALTQDTTACLALLERSGLAFDALPPHGADSCIVPDAVRLGSGQAMLALAPANVAPSCPVMLGLALWHWRVVQPAAQRHLKSSVARIDTFGSFACRRTYGREAGAWSEHATADAIDVSGFTLADGRRITIAGDWSAQDETAAFLREVRDGACQLFSTVLSPDYNAAHRDHLHLDQARRAAMGWRACR